MKTKSFFTIMVFCTLTSSAWAEVKPNALFSDNAVLQQNAKVPVWGTAAPNENVTVEFAGQKKNITADAQGRWQVTLDPMPASTEPRNLTISGNLKSQISNFKCSSVLVGEVWVCSGQSNMAFPLAKAANWNTEAHSANYPKLRMFKVELVNALAPETDVVGKWVESSPATVKDFSAVGYFFGRDLHKATGLPVGMINSSVGGTPAEFWTSASGLKKLPALHGYLDMLTKKPPQQAKSNNPFNKFPTCYFNGMVAPLMPYAIKGVVWYQGESNNGKPLEYRTLFPLMIADWREKWGQGDFPFLFVQIAPYKDDCPELREAQFLTWKKTPNTAMAVTVDVGDANNIHPTHKEPVGQRLALAARALAYGEKIEYSGPEYDSMKVDKNRVMLNFKHVGSGLVAKDGPLKGFTIAGADKKFVDAKAEIQGAMIVVTSDQIASPVAVRYGFTNIPEGNLWNKQGLPASTFRTDPESLTQEPPKVKKPPQP